MGNRVVVIYIVLFCVWSIVQTKIHYNDNKDTNVLYQDSDLPFPPMEINSRMTSSDSSLCPAGSRKAVYACFHNLHMLAINGFPWGYKKIHQEEQVPDKIGDPLDPINYACKMFEDFLTCLEDHSIPDECLFTANEYNVFEAKVSFSLVCTEKRSTDLFHSLKCLQETRVVDLMELHLANRYGSSVLDKERQGRKNAYFTFLDN